MAWQSGMVLCVKAMCMVRMRSCTGWGSQLVLSLDEFLCTCAPYPMLGLHAAAPECGSGCHSVLSPSMVAAAATVC